MFTYIEVVPWILAFVNKDTYEFGVCLAYLIHELTQIVGENVVELVVSSFSFIRFSITVEQMVGLWSHWVLQWCSLKFSCFIGCVPSICLLIKEKIFFNTWIHSLGPAIQ